MKMKKYLALLIAVVLMAVTIPSAALAYYDPDEAAIRLVLNYNLLIPHEADYIAYIEKFCKYDDFLKMPNSKKTIDELTRIFQYWVSEYNESIKAAFSKKFPMPTTYSKTKINTGVVVVLENGLTKTLNLWDSTFTNDEVLGDYGSYDDVPGVTLVKSAPSIDGYTIVGFQKTSANKFVWSALVKPNAGYKLPDYSKVKIEVDSSMTDTSILGDKPSDWAIDSVNEASRLNLAPEALLSKFTSAITRAEFTVLAVALYEVVTGEEIADRVTFSDTADINVQKAAAIGVVSGVGGGKFSPDATLTREQAATMLARLANAMERPLESSSASFADNKSASDWALDAIGQMQASGIMSGVGDNKFSPKGEYTREQSIITILRMFDYAGA